MQLHGLDENQMKDDRENIKEKNKKNNTNENIKLMMNSKELNVNVPLATVDSDSEEFEGFSEFSLAGGEQKSSNVSPENGVLNLGGGGMDSMTGSLEDLVSTFDEKLTMCFADYQEQVDKIAPVQVRSQEEIMNECQVWWTLTGNFGNIMPIDWSKTYTRAKHIPTLNLCDPRPTGDIDGDGAEDDMVAADLDMHQLILNSDSQKSDPIKSAEEVLQEIDDIIDDDDEDDDEDGREPVGLDPPGFLPPHSIRSSTFIGQALQGRKLEDLSVQELSQILSDVETLVRDLSEELVADLGTRDELEFEKELKNNFISLLLSIQSKRRQSNIDGQTSKRSKNRRDDKYLTTVIPYNAERGCPPLPTLQVLVKILKSINEDSPAVPALLTDYILKILCPT
ncbi:fasciculation and elongation protein zeta-2 [Eurytemora carolleeae]|uniref:fasciculation and elongation protein zeta-2 n=1 Tax=Eurytemora carolleeae TaxID=1294199 RepID=UPI000C765415|nr:fasciculation and elongation protein zeta-2 [Eurytemora carolleeae]XP_023341560.1 fasciculation and elongation protein zeta-2 [Eurytemora carolleeae]|eukprot:XP_023341553.1 fasciculation and elongation protein zeta-2-like [Eurytemora affinis]